MFNMKLIQGAIKLIPRVSFSFRCFYTTLSGAITVGLGSITAISSLDQGYL